MYWQSAGFHWPIKRSLGQPNWLFARGLVFLFKDCSERNLRGNVGDLLPMLAWIGFVTSGIFCLSLWFFLIFLDGIVDFCFGAWTRLSFWVAGSGRLGVFGWKRESGVNFVSIKLATEKRNRRPIEDTNNNTEFISNPQQEQQDSNNSRTKLQNRLLIKEFAKWWPKI